MQAERESSLALLLRTALSRDVHLTLISSDLSSIVTEEQSKTGQLGGGVPPRDLRGYPYRHIRGTIVIRSRHMHKTFYVPVFVRVIFGPDYLCSNELGS